MNGRLHIILAATELSLVHVISSYVVHHACMAGVQCLSLFLQSSSKGPIHSLKSRAGRSSSPPVASKTTPSSPFRKQSIIPRGLQPRRTQSSSDFKRKKPPPDYKPLPLLKGNTFIIFHMHTRHVCISMYLLLLVTIATSTLYWH